MCIILYPTLPTTPPILPYNAHTYISLTHSPITSSPHSQTNLSQPPLFISPTLITTLPILPFPFYHFESTTQQAPATLFIFYSILFYGFSSSYLRAVYIGSMLDRIVYFYLAFAFFWEVLFYEIEVSSIFLYQLQEKGLLLFCPAF